MANGKSKLCKQGVKKVVSIWTTLNTCKRIIVTFGGGVVAVKGVGLNTSKQYNIEGKKGNGVRGGGRLV